MPPLKNIIRNALNETRTLMLGVEIVIAFDLQSFFQKGFPELPIPAQLLKIAGLCGLLLAVALLLAPITYHHIAIRGEDSPGLNHFTSKIAFVALLLFAFGLTIDIYIVAEKVFASALAIVIGGLAFLSAIVFWYGVEFIARDRLGPEEKEKRQVMEHDNEAPPIGQTPLKDRIEQVMTETRTVLPGNQAFLGFQFAVVLIDGFEKISFTLKVIHLVSLGWIALSTIFLMAPAAYHRIVEMGQDSERFHRFATQMVLAALATLALGLAGDLYVVLMVVLNSSSLALAGALLSLIVTYSLWFGYMWMLRSKNYTEDQASAHS